MQAWLRDDNGQLLATIINDKVFPAPGVDRQAVAFELFKAMMAMMSMGASVTWGQAWMSGNMGSATSPGA